jgi:hypothetical protein
MIKFNSTLAFMLVFVMVMIGSGVVSGLKGYTLGYEALKEVSQPKVKPGQKRLNNPNNQSLENQAAIVSEAEVLQQVNAQMNRKQEKAVPLTGKKTSTNNENNENNESFIESP